MSIKFKTCLTLAVVLLQVTVLSHFTILGIIPNYVLIFTFAICIARVIMTTIFRNSDG